MNLIWQNLDYVRSKFVFYRHKSNWQFQEKIHGSSLLPSFSFWFLESIDFRTLLLSFSSLSPISLNNCLSQTYTESCQIFKMVLFAKIVNDWKLLSIFAKSSILVVWQGSEYTSGCCAEVFLLILEHDTTKPSFYNHTCF